VSSLITENLLPALTTLIYKVSKSIRLKVRFEYLHLNKNQISITEKGFITYQDILYQPVDNLRFYGRIIFFQTDSYDSRMYEFENDLTGVLYNPPLFGKGLRWYFIVRHSLFDNLTLSLKYSELYKPCETSISSGLAEIEGNLDNKIGFQVDFKF